MDYFCRLPVSYFPRDKSHTHRSAEHDGCDPVLIIHSLETVCRTCTEYFAVWDCAFSCWKYV